ncbi:MAG: 3'(2'),5'-bisphosphate nucleotidase CysQ [Nanoarchaeota archaeon]
MNELELALDLAQEAGSAIMQLYGRNIHTESKSDGTPVTEADLLANRIILEGIRKHFSQDGIVSEESEPVPGGRTWYIDPIDGTKGFIRQNGEFAIHIGMCTREEPTLGVVYQPTTQTVYVGIQGEGAYKQQDGKKTLLRVLPFERDLTAIISNHGFDRKTVLEQVRRLQPKKIILSGGSGLRLMKIAENQGDYYLSAYADHEQRAGTWDVCAPQAILEEAGGYICYANGQPIRYHGQKRLDSMLVAVKTLDQIADIREKLNWKDNP